MALACVGPQSVPQSAGPAGLTDVDHSSALIPRLLQHVRVHRERLALVMSPNAFGEELRTFQGSVEDDVHALRVGKIDLF
jgi:hypothetical protein